MNILGHAYVATKAVKGERKLLIIGSLLPESTPFISNNPFTWEEIHESGEKFLKFLDQRYPEKRDLALGILAHSYKFGADKFSKQIEILARGDKEELAQKIVDCSGIELEAARKWRIHNYLGWGIDVWILKNNPEFVKEVKRVLKGVDISEVSRLLAECFDKNFEKVEKTFRMLFMDIYQPEDLNCIAGLARIWVRQAAGLPEKDKVNVNKAKIIFKECAELIKDEWKEFLTRVISETRKSLTPFLS